MQKQALGRYLFLGTSLRFLQDATPGLQIKGWGSALYNLTRFWEEIRDLRLRVTYSVFQAQGLEGLLDELNKSDEERLTEEQAKLLAKGMNMVRETLLAEAGNLPVYLLTERRFEVSRLVDSPETLLQADTFNKLPPIAQGDLREAAKCIAFDTPTAAGFLLLRATEGALSAYYGKHFKVKKDEKLMWGPMIIRLRSKSKKPRPNKILLDHLDNIRHNFRNPTDHPEKVYSVDEVQDLFSLVTDVLNRIAAELP